MALLPDPEDSHVKATAQERTTLAHVRSQEEKILWVQKASRETMMFWGVGPKGTALPSFRAAGRPQHRALEDRRINQGQCWYLTPPPKVLGFCRLNFKV